MMKNSILLCVGLSSVAWADWQSHRIDISFLTTKVTAADAVVIEHNRFTKATAQIDTQGYLTAVVMLNSLQTGIELRNQRVQQRLDAQAHDDKMTVAGRLNIHAINALKIGETLQVTQPLHVTLGQHTANVQAQLQVIRLATGDLWVTTIAPIMVDADTLGMGEGINQLVDLAKLRTIAHRIPVMFEATLSSTAIQ